MKGLCGVLLSFLCETHSQPTDHDDGPEGGHVRDVGRGDCRDTGGPDCCQHLVCVDAALHSGGDELGR